MPLEVLGLESGVARLQILRRRTRDDRRLAKLARDDVVRPHAADADGEGETLLDQGDDAVGERDIEAQLPMLREELGDCRGEMAYAEIHRGGEPDHAARHDRRARGLALSFLEVGKQLHGALVEGAPTLGEAHATRGAVEEPGL